MHFYHRRISRDDSSQHICTHARHAHTYNAHVPALHPHGQKRTGYVEARDRCVECELKANLRGTSGPCVRASTTFPAKMEKRVEGYLGVDI